MVSPLTILLRFILGIILGACLALASNISLPINIILMLSLGTAAAIWGDKLILGIMSLMRYLR
jgi:hypothetical protein